MSKWNDKNFVMAAVVQQCASKALQRDPDVVMTAVVQQYASPNLQRDPDVVWC